MGAVRMIRFDGQDYEEATFPPQALYHLHRGYEIKRAADRATRDLQKAIEDMSIAQVTLESLSALGNHSEDVIRKELAALEPSRPEASLDHIGPMLKFEGQELPPEDPTPQDLDAEFAYLNGDRKEPLRYPSNHV